MSRLAPLTPEEMTEAQRQVYEELQQAYQGRVAITHLTWLRSPALASHIARFGPYIRHQCLDYRKRELAILIVGRASKSPVEWYLHLPFAREAGIEEDIITALAEKRRPAFARPDDDALYDFASELLQDGHAVSDATYAKAMGVLGAEQVVELVAITGYYVMMAMLIGAFQFQLPEGEKPAFTD
jgi:4-carboxymuconolactone decarboxylase